MEKKLMKRIKTVICFWLCIFIATYLVEEALSADCSTISRTNNSSNTVLTSSGYNTDHNTAYSAINDIVSSNCTLPLASINQTELGVPLDAVQQGCKISYSNASTISIGKCYASVNGAWVETSAATTVEFGCTNCSAEAASTLYYVYIADGSTGSTLTPLILTGAPNENAYDSSDNLVLGNFFNDGSQDIATGSLSQWVKNDFPKSENTAGKIRTEACRVEYGSSSWSKGSDSGLCDNWITTIAWDGTGLATINFVDGTFTSPPVCIAMAGGASRGANMATFETISSVQIRTEDTPTGADANVTFNLMCMGLR